MTNMKISFDGEIVRRWKETTRAGKEMFYISVKVPRGEYADELKVKVKDAETVKPYAVGAKVSVEAFVGGRSWTNPETKKIVYFMDINLFKIQLVEEKQAEDEAKVSYDSVADDMPF